MLSSSVILWLVLAAGFLILEGATVALVSLWFAVGSLAALGVAVSGAAFWLQAAVFVAVSGALLAMLRPMLRKHMKITKTNVDSIVGTQGLVTQDIDNIAYSGEVKLGAMTWTARSTDGTHIPTGTRVRVDKIEGVKVYVSPAAETVTL